MKANRKLTRRELQQKQRKQHLHDMCQCFRRVYETADGRRVIEQICQMICLERQPTFSTDQMVTNNRAVRKDVALEIRNYLTGMLDPPSVGDDAFEAPDEGDEVLPGDDSDAGNGAEGEIRDE